MGQPPAWYECIRNEEIEELRKRISTIRLAQMKEENGIDDKEIKEQCSPDLLSVIKRHPWMGDWAGTIKDVCIGISTITIITLVGYFLFKGLIK